MPVPWSRLVNAAIVSALIAIGLSYLCPPILGTIGFTPGGVAAGSMAAGIQSSIGNVVAGSMFAICQSITMGGSIPFLWIITSATAAAGLGALIGWVSGPDRGDSTSPMSRFWSRIQSTARSIFQESSYMWRKIWQWL
ncbi:uncharacterized protein FIBRA_07957 [Fibroporia radiculosa]|uniref:Uncharacterized protein n=1 Tax=Fibroporia radiculosa TaxID=599839 RepID=J4GVX1_9APHY|nr:uncharacterized protein FIBRA_07957 [Fibroporia radiculosa]CCM05725.1 predicted protein [Fibroporia radiculosa]